MAVRAGLFGRMCGVGNRHEALVALELKRGHWTLLCHPPTVRFHLAMSTSLQSLVSELESGGSLALLEAASCSPTAAHFLPSIGAIYNVVVRCLPGGNREATPTDLALMTTMAMDLVPGLEAYQDHVPPDPRKSVSVRFGDGVFRIVPGAIERPVAMINRAHLVAEVVDGVLIPSLGFGLADYVEVALRRIDAVVQAVASAWDEAPPADPAAEPFIREAELLACMNLPDIDAMVLGSASENRAEAALKWATRTVDELAGDPFDPSATFSVGLAYAVDGKRIPVPAGFMLESINAAMINLADQACRIDPVVDDRFGHACMIRAAELLDSAGQQFFGPVQVDGIGRVHSIVAFDPGHFLVADVKASLRAENLNQEGESEDRNVLQVGPGTRFRTPHGFGRIPSDAEVVPLLVAAGPSLLSSVGQGGLALMSLEDLEWIVSASDDDPDEVFLFCADMADPSGVQTLLSFETIDRFEGWRANQKSLHQQGLAPTGIVFAPHGGDAEWHESAQRSWLEVALAELHLPGVQDWDIVKGPEGRVADVAAADLSVAWKITDRPRPIGIRLFDDRIPPHLRHEIASVAFSIPWKADRISDDFERLANVCVGDRPIRILFQYSATPIEGRPMMGRPGDDSSVILEWDSRLLDGSLDGSAVESAVAEGISEALGSCADRDVTREQTEFIAAWLEAAPGFRIDEALIAQAIMDLPHPIRSHEALRSAARRDLAERLRGRGVEPGLYSGDAAIALESQEVYSELLEMLHRVLNEFDSEEVLRFAMVQLERAHAQRFQDEMRLGWNLQLPELEFDPVETETATRDDAIKLGRALGMLIEEVLRDPPSGYRQLGRLDWRRILSATELCLESCIRSESLRYGLVSVATQISDEYLVSLVPGDLAPLVDLDAFAQAEVSRSMPTAPDADLRLEDDAAPEDLGVLSIEPELHGIDTALRSERGFGLDPLLGTLIALRTWPVEAGEEITTADHTELCAFVAGLLPTAPPAEIVAVISNLTLEPGTLRQEQPLEHWELERRNHRLLTRPLVPEGNGRFYVAPWFFEAVARVFTNYITDGRLPWPESSFGPDLRRAYRDYWSLLNVALEHDVEGAFLALDMPTRRNVKKAKVLGLQKLLGEIDVVAVDSSRGTIWVCEAKDTRKKMSVAQISRVVKDFLGTAGHVDKLLAKVEDVRTNPAAVAMALGVEEDHEWLVEPLMVTRHLEPAAFAPESRVPIVTIGALSDYLASWDRPSD